MDQRKELPLMSKRTIHDEVMVILTVFSVILCTPFWNLSPRSNAMRMLGRHDVRNCAPCGNNYNTIRLFYWLKDLFGYLRLSSFGWLSSPDPTYTSSIFVRGPLVFIYLFYFGTVDLFRSDMQPLSQVPPLPCLYCLHGIGKGHVFAEGWFCLSSLSLSRQRHDISSYLPIYYS